MLVTRSVRCVKRSHVYYRCNYAVGAEEGEIKKISCLYEERGRGSQWFPARFFKRYRVSRVPLREMVYESINCRILIMESNISSIFREKITEGIIGIPFLLELWNFPSPLNSSILQTRKREYNAFIKVEKKRRILRHLNEIIFIYY